MNDGELFKYNEWGLIPGPGEAEDAFLKRVDYCLNLEKNIENDVAPAPKQVLEQPLLKTKDLYGINPEWIPLYFSNHQLSPWQGGCAWIFQKEENTPTASLIQLRKAFYDKEKYLGLYEREELLVHELCHAGRMMFEEPKFEEVLAYRSSESSFRRWFGPIIQSSTETLLFVATLAIIIGLDFLFLFSNQFELYYRAMWLKLIPFLLVLYGVVRLWRKQKIFDECLKKLKQILGNEKKARGAIFRLTDEEIISFSKKSPQQILEDVNKRKNHSLRERLIALLFDNND